MSRLSAAVLAVTSHLELPLVLAEIIEVARDLTGARYAALGVLDRNGDLETFANTGMPPATAAMMELPHGRGVLGAIPTEGELILEDLTKHKDSIGFPPHHPPMVTFLGVPVRIGGEVFGRLYLTEKDGGFTAEDAANMHLLAAATAVAVQNSGLYTAARTRERWLEVGQEITLALLTGTEVEEALELIANRLRMVAEADAAYIVLRGVGADWVIEIADGPGSEDLIGTVMPPEGRAHRVLRSEEGMIVDSLSRATSLRVPEFGRYGPALYTPLTAEGAPLGVIILMRRKGAPEFTEADLTIATSIAGQAALALKLAEARAAKDLASVLDERARIAQDLHDLAIQQLFATGLQLTKAKDSLDEPDLKAVLTEALDGVDDSVRQIRAIVHALRSADDNAPLLQRLQRETSLARTGLGFAPSLVVDSPDVKQEDLDALVDLDLADDIVAVVREGLANAARHARATAVHVRLGLCRQTIRIEVEDDGVGIDPERARNSGLSNLGARARRHGGLFALERPGDEPRPGSRLVWTAQLHS